MSKYPKENVSYRYNFTKEEQEINSQLMANAAVAIGELEDEKKAIASEYKAKIDAKTAELNLLSRHVIDKYTQKTSYLNKRKNFDTMRWEWFDDDGVLLKTEPLAGKDRQRDIDFDGPQPDETTQANRQAEPQATEQDAEPVGGDESLTDLPPLPPLETIVNMGKPTLSLGAVVSPEVEDLENGEEPAPETTLEPLEAKVIGLPEPSAEPTETTDGEEKEDRNEGADFNADAFNPESENSLSKHPAKKLKAAKKGDKAAADKKKPGRPKNS